MTLSEFKHSIKESSPPAGISKTLEAMWYDAKGDWNMSHSIAQEINNSSGSWIHAYLHRKERDNSNASYWYSKAGKTLPDLSLNEEWETIVSSMLD